MEQGTGEDPVWFEIGYHVIKSALDLRLKCTLIQTNGTTSTPFRLQAHI